MFSFVRNHPSVFQSGCTVLHSHQQRMRVPVAPHPHQHLLLSVFWSQAILVSVQWYLVLCCISLMTYDGANLFICLFVTLYLLCSSLAHFLNWVVFLLLCFKSSLYIQDNSPLPGVSSANIFSQLFSNSPASVFWRTEVFSFSEVQFIFFFFLRHHHTQGHLGFLLSYLPGVLQFCILHLGLGPLSVNFYKGHQVCDWISFFLFFFFMCMSGCSSIIC